ncbi:hypothetical protein FRB91_001495 [Serendipita sp. 411]|nr:hypothetical protein FRB91_001495 [Serendipita sp. 411]
MADPGTILAIIQTCLKVGKLAHQIQSDYSTANETLTSITRECDTLKDVLLEVEKLADSHDRVDRLQNNNTFKNALEHALASCHRNLDALLDQLEHLSPSKTPDGQITTWSMTAKFKFLWRKSFMKEYLDYLRGSVQDLTFLMSVYQFKATRDIDVALNDLRPRMERMDEGISQLLRRSDSPVSSAKSGYVESIFRGPRSSVIPQRMQSSSAPSDTVLPDPPLAERSFLQNIIVATPGQSEDQVLESLKRIKDFGDADDYILAREAIIANGHKLLECLRFLAKIRSYGTADDYGEALLVLSVHKNDLQATFHWLSEIQALGTQDDYTLALAAIRNNKFAFQRVKEALIYLKTMSTSFREYSCMLGYLKSKSYQLASTQENLSTLKDVSGPHKYLDALLRLEENKFSMEKTLDELCQAKSSPNPTHAPLPSSTATLPPRSSPPFVGGFNPHLPHPSGLDLSTILPTSPLTAPPTMISFPVPPSEHGLTGQLHRSFMAPSSTTNGATMRNKERSK